MDHNHMEITQDAAGDYRWSIWIGDPPVVLAYSGHGYANESDCLHSLFGIFFGTWDESFLANYGKWMKYSGEKVPYDLPPESTEGIPVRIADADGWNSAKAEDVVPQINNPADRPAP